MTDDTFTTYHETAATISNCGSTIEPDAASNDWAADVWDTDSFVFHADFGATDNAFV